MLRGTGRTLPDVSRIAPKPTAILLAGVLATFGIASGDETHAKVEARKTIDFTRDVRPILAKNCFDCHGPDETHRKGGLRLDSAEFAFDETDSGQNAIVPGKLKESTLYERITSTSKSKRMPPAKSGPALTPQQIDLIKRWIESGATYSEHWSFIAPKRPSFPNVHRKTWPAAGLDHFILSKLEEAQLAPSPPADKHALIRRLSLDLRGLPPTIAEIEAFIAYDAPDAYDRLVDHMLDDPAFGERWARVWLDLARYADSSGLGSDPLRVIWRYRDWVIDAINANKPYDQFTIEQLAGDLLPSPTTDQLLATAFHRNTMTNTEGGTDDEEFRVAAVKDRVDTTMQVWMGLTFGCAKCHNHKFDPISIREYYQFYAFFNQTEDNDQPNESPTLPTPTDDQKRQMAAIERRLAELRPVLETSTPELVAAQLKWESELSLENNWQSIEPIALKREQSVPLTAAAVGSLPTQGAESPSRLVLVAKTELPQLTAVRIDMAGAAPPTAPSAATESAFNTNRWRLAGLSIEGSVTAKEIKPIAGRFVRIELPGDSKMLSLAEVEVSSGGKNSARAGAATQSSVDYEGPAQLAIDGNTDGRYYEAKSTTHTKSEKDPWWEVDLKTVQPIDRIAIWNRTDGDVGGRIKGAVVNILDAERRVVWSHRIEAPPKPSVAFTPGTWSEYPVQGNEADVYVFGAPLTTTNAGAVRLQFEWSGLAEPPAGRIKVALRGDDGLQRRADVPRELLAIVDALSDKRDAAQKDQLAKYYRSIAPALAKVRDEVAALEKCKPAFTMTAVMRELSPDKRRTTNILLKGSFQSPGEKVEPFLPAAFNAMPSGANADRLGVARWIVSRDNPLTARVAVNRIWARLFGVGIVETEEDFGTQGELPSNPELLDWLAIEFMDQGWDLKRLLRTIVTSSTYKQSARVTPELLEKDPRNFLLSRAPRLRLEAEMVRDQALALSGLLSRKMMGPSVFPAQPDGLWQAAFNGERTWATSKGEDRVRRGLYTFWRRTVPYPSMATFDAPSRETCTVRRISTNTPLQAFVTLNDPVYVEAAQSLARRIIREGGKSIEERARFGLLLCTGRPASPEQVAVMVDLYRKQQTYSKEKDRALQLATEPIGPLPSGLDPAEAAAWTVVANVLLNLDSVLTRG